MGNTPHTSKNNFFESKFDAFNDTKKDGIHVETIQLYSSPEGGKKGWMVAITSFLVNGIIFGTINSFGIIFPELRTVHKDKIEVSARVSFVGSLAFGVTFIFIPVSGMLMDKLGLRVCTFIGACIAFFGMIMASLVFHKLELLYLSSLLFGVGSSMVFVPSMAILPQYFQDQLSMVNSFVSCGNCVFTIMIPHILRSILDTFQLKGAYYFLCGMTSLLIIPSITFSQILKTKVKKKSCLNAFKSHFNLSLLKNKIYIAWTIGF
uniref:Monocarboxylate transporter 10like [Apis florea] n=2 Tax=Lepeophtheirus salmonis TaxID=72036 RepID=A0A0K2V2E9_LEPSM